MRKLKAPFATPTNNPDPFYDIIEDYDLIEASFAEQYGIRLRREFQMSWSEFITLLAGLNEKTPLGKIVAIRSEQDPEILKRFSSEQKRIRNEWRNKSALSISKQEYDAAMNGFKAMFLSMAGKEAE